MNLNSLIIVADASAARLLRTAQTPDLEHPLELVEVGYVTADDERTAMRSRREPSMGAAVVGTEKARNSRSDTELGAFAQRVAERAAAFARDHFCNPVIVTANEAVTARVLRALEHELPNAHVRPVFGEMSERPLSDVLDYLQRLEAFTPPRYPTRGS